MSVALAHAVRCTFSVKYLRAEERVRAKAYLKVDAHPHPQYQLDNGLTRQSTLSVK